MYDNLFQVNKDQFRLQQIDIDDLVEGNDYSFRVKAENEAGVGEPTEIGPITAKAPFGKYYLHRLTQCMNFSVSGHLWVSNDLLYVIYVVVYCILMQSTKIYTICWTDS